jgi:hypothetical protein
MSINTLIQKATNPKNETEDWDSILQICDLLGQRPDETCKTVCDSIFNLLSDPHPRVRYFALSLLDACVKNTNKFFQQTLLHHPKIFQLDSMLKDDSDVIVVEKWEEVSEEWRKDYNVLYQASIGKRPASMIQEEQLYPSTLQYNEPVYHAPPPPPTSLQPKKDTKERLLDDLVVVETSCKTMAEYLEQAESPQSMKTDLSVQQLYMNMKEMNRRLIILIERVPDEDLMMRSLEVHELLSDTIEQYEHYVKTGQKKPGRARETKRSQKSENVLDDIDLFFGDSSAVHADRKGKGIAKSNPDYNPFGSDVETMSLDDFLGQSSTQSTSLSSSQYGTSNDPFSMGTMEIELNNIGQEKAPSLSTSSGFAALARRKSKAITPNPFDTPPAETNPFADTQNNNTQIISFDPTDIPVSSHIQSSAPQAPDDFDHQSGFAALAHRKKGSPSPIPFQEPNINSSGSNKSHTNANLDDPFL